MNRLSSYTTDCCQFSRALCLLYIIHVWRWFANANADACIWIRWFRFCLAIIGVCSLSSSFFFPMEILPSLSTGAYDLITIIIWDWILLADKFVTEITVHANGWEKTEKKESEKHDLPLVLQASVVIFVHRFIYFYHIHSACWSYVLRANLRCEKTKHGYDSSRSSCF